MRRFRGSAVVAAARKERESALRSSLVEEVALFDRLAASCQLPWIDQQWYHKELLDGASEADIPKLRALNDVLEAQCTLSEKALVLCGEREALLADLLTLGSSCLQGRSVGCSEERHVILCSKLEELDHFTDAILALILKWRSNLTHPLPFIFKGENYMAKMLGQYSQSTALAAIASHIRSVCRIKPYMYQSPYDLALPPSLTTHDRGALVGELHRQVKCSAELLGLAKCGLYAPVLKFPLRRPHIPIVNKKWKERLVLCYAGAHHDGWVALNSSAATHIASQFVQGSSRAMYIRYFRKWAEWSMRRKDKAKAAADFYTFTSQLHLRNRFSDWSSMTALRRERAVGLGKILAASQMALRAVCMRRWFLSHKGRVMFEAVRKVVCLRYFRALHFKALRKRIEAQGETTVPPTRFISMLRCDLGALSEVVAMRPDTNSTSSLPVNERPQEVAEEHETEAEVSTDGMDFTLESEAKPSPPGSLGMRSNQADLLHLHEDAFADSRSISRNQPGGEGTMPSESPDTTNFTLESSVQDSLQRRDAPAAESAPEPAAESTPEQAAESAPEPVAQ